MGGDRGFPNETVGLLIERASCRSFTEQEIPAEILQLVLEAGTHAATGGNLQPYSIIKIEGEETKQTLARLGGQAFIGEAPVLLLFCIDLHRLQRWAALEVAPFTARDSFQHFWISFQDTVICAQSVCTAADALGLGSVYIGTVLEFFHELRDMFALPQGVFPVVLLCLGFPRSRPKPRNKLGVDVIVHEERYRELEDQELLATFDEKYGQQRFGITEERLETIEQVCREVHGEAFARRCLEWIKEQGYISAAQRYFCLKYQANIMPQGNEAFLETLEAFGFGCFKPFDPQTDC